jgi:hypothetical protein
MKNKKVFLISSFIILIAVTVAIVILISDQDKVITSPVIQTTEEIVYSGIPENEEERLPSIQGDLPFVNETENGPGSCLVLEEEYCGTSTFRVSKFDSSRVPGVNFTVPEGTKIYAPYDGVIGVSSASYKQDGHDISTLLISISKLDKWDPTSAFGPGTYRIDFMTNNFRRVNGLGTDTRVKKGQLIGTVGSEDLIFSDLDQNAGNLAVAPIGSWAKDDGLLGSNTSTEYISRLFGSVNN